MSIKNLKDFVETSSQKDLSPETFELESSHLLEVKLNGRIWAKSGSMVAYRGGVKFVRQGMLEGSNVKPILEITRMIEVSRAYESTARMMDSTAELSKSAVARMGRVQ